MNRPVPLPPTMRVFERDWLSSNNVLFDDGRRAALLDTGHVKHAALTEALVAHALGDRPLDLVLNTHLHSDHCGGNARLRARWGCRIAVPVASVDAVRRWDEDALSFRATGQRCDRFVADDALEPGTAVELGGLGWEVIAAPGHDPHAVVLWCDQHRVLVSADALWERGFGAIFPELDGGGGFAEQRAILDRIAALDVRVVVPGHGPVFEGFSESLRVAYARLEHLSAAPERNARNAVKVLVKFLLLDLGAIPLDRLPALCAGVPLIREADRRYLGFGDEARLAHWIADELVKAGVAAFTDGRLVDR